MNIRKIIASTMPEAMQKVKAELGDNAVILNSKVIYQGGFLGILRKKKFEVIAALDENPVRPVQITKNKNRQMPIKYESATLQDTTTKESIKTNKGTTILEEIATLKNELELMKNMNDVDLRQYPDVIQACLQRLKKTGINASYIQKFGDILVKKWRNSQSEINEADILKWCKLAMIEELATFNSSKAFPSSKFINIVGPTGVGKTTTIAKLAAEAVLEQGKKAAFITTDTYRIAAIDQLKTYAELLGIPLEIIYEEKDFREAIEKFSDYDVVFIDTAGRNYREKHYIQDLKILFGDEQIVDTYLVLSLSMKEGDIQKIVENFLDMEIKQFVFSKADETSSYGAMYNLINQYEIGVAFITNGQDVPDDIVTATPEVITDYILRNER